MDAELHIKPYDRQGWDQVLAAFCDYLQRMTDYSRKHRALADETRHAHEQAIEKWKAYMQSENKHILGRGSYTKTGIVLCETDHRQHCDQWRLDTHVSGVPVVWRFSKPLVASDDDRLLMRSIERKLAA